MIIRTLFGTTFFVVAAIWVIMIVIERDPCRQVQAAAAPVRVVMDTARALDKNLQFVTDRYTWMLWRHKADAIAQSGIARVMHGRGLSCNTF